MVLAENAEEIECNDCLRLKSLRAPKAKVLSCANSKSLMFLNAPSAEEITCFDCKYLMYLDARNAKELRCRNTALQIILAPNAKLIDCGSKRLREIWAPVAEEIDITMPTGSIKKHPLTIVAAKSAQIDCDIDDAQPTQISHLKLKPTVNSLLRDRLMETYKEGERVIFSPGNELSDYNAPSSSNIPQQLQKLHDINRQFRNL